MKIAIKNKNSTPKGIRKIRKFKKVIKPNNFRQDRRGAVFLSNLPDGFYERALHGYLEQFGNITKLKVAKSPKNARPMGYAYVEFENEKVALIVARTMNNYLMFKKLLKCEFIKHDNLNNKMWKRFNITPELCPGTIGKRRNQHILESGASENYKVKKEKQIEKIKSYLQYTLGIDMGEDKGQSGENSMMETDKCDPDISTKTQSSSEKASKNKPRKLIPEQSEVQKSPNSITNTIKRKSRTAILNVQKSPNIKNKIINAKPKKVVPLIGDVQKSPNSKVINAKSKKEAPLVVNIQKAVAVTKKVANSKSKKFESDKNVKISPVAIKKATKKSSISRRLSPVIIDANSIVQKSPLKQSSLLLKKAEAKRTGSEKKMKLEVATQNDTAKSIKSIQNPRSKKFSDKSPLQNSRRNRSSDMHKSIKKDKISAAENSKVKSKISMTQKATMPSPNQMLKAKKGRLGVSLKASTTKQKKILPKQKSKTTLAK